LVVASAFVVGIGVGRRFGPKRQAGAQPPAEVEPFVPAPTTPAELAERLAQADALYRQQDFGAAADHYEAARQYANTVEVHLKAALIYEAANRRLEALPCLIDALKADPNDATVCYHAARMLADLGRGAYPQALAQAKRAQELGYDVPDELWQQLEKLREENERAKREGRPTPGNPMAGMHGRRGRPDIRQLPR